MNQKGGPTNTKHCFHECSAWPGIHVHHAAESAFTFSGIRKKAVRCGLEGDWDGFLTMFTDDTRLSEKPSIA